MRISFNREGGYASLRLKYQVNTDELPKDAAEKLLNLVKSSGVLELKQSDLAPDTGVATDVFSYKLTISEGGKSKSLSFNDITVPASLRPLLVFLQEFLVVP
jgi:hypothetical protein